MKFIKFLPLNPAGQPIPRWAKAPPRSVSLTLNLCQFRSQYSPRLFTATEHIYTRDWHVAEINPHVAALNRSSASGTPATSTTGEIRSTKSKHFQAQFCATKPRIGPLRFQSPIEISRPNGHILGRLLPIGFCANVQRLLWQHFNKN